MYLEYNRKKPTSVIAKVGEFSSLLLISNKSEYVRALSVNNDKHLINKIVDSINPGELFWDIGANIGLYTTLVAKAVGKTGKVIAFEPEKRAYKRLLENIASNELLNVSAYNTALGSDNKKMKLHVSKEFSSGTHSLIESSESRDCDEVNVFKGDDFIVKENLQVPTVIKIDVEGAEYDVLLGMNQILASRKCRVVICEVHFSILASCNKNHVPSAIVNDLKSYGFTQVQWLDHSHLLACRNK